MWVQARVRALRSSEKQLHVLMERAEAVKDILAVSRELSRVTMELEAQLIRSQAVGLHRASVAQARGKGGRSPCAFPALGCGCSRLCASRGGG